MELKVNFKGGGSFVEIPPKFSLNTQTIFVAWKHQILGYNVTTGKRVSIFTGMNSKIVDFYVHSLDVYECITACSINGELVTWKTATFFKVGNSELGIQSIKTFTIYCPENSYEIKALISYQAEDSINFVLYDFNEGKSEEYLFALKSDFPYFIDILPRGYFVVAQKHKVYFLHINDFQQIHSFKMQKSRHFTCLSCHPTDDSLLTGDNTGRIVLWQNILNTKTKPTQTVYHWHTLSVNCINFTMNGTQFFSGGNESVLVKWYIDNTNEKNFLPRLPSEIKHIKLSLYNRYISLSLNDNSIYIIDTEFRKISIIQYLIIGDLLGDGNIVYDTRTKCLLLNGNPGCLQFYLPNDGSLLYNVDVVDANKISNERNCEIKNTQITWFTIDKSGLWLSTIEENQFYQYSPEIRLKFWQFNMENQQFKLNTSIEYPHTTKLNCIKFQPIDDNDKNRLKCITVGDDKLFKIWQLTDINDSKKYGWIFYSCGFYRNLSCCTVSFSIDGTLFGVNFDSYLTLWSPETNELKTTLSNPYCKEIIKNINFGTQNQCHLIVTATKNSLTVWNILTLTILWMVNVQIDLFINDYITTNMAIITKNRQLIVFSPISPQPIYKSGKLLKGFKKIRNCCFVPTKYSNDVRLKWYQRSTIFFINSKKQLYCIGDDEDESVSLFYDDNDIDNKFDNSESLLDKINPKIKSNSQQSNIEKQTVVLPEQKNIKKYLEAPIHSSVPVRILCKTLLKSMVLQK